MLEYPSARVPPPVFVHAEAVRRPWAVRLAVALVLLGAVFNLNFLWNHCPIGLVDDEAHYYLWAQPRQLDYGYYSKPPGIAWVMASAEGVGRMFGVEHATMPVLRTAAVLFSVLTGLLSLALARRMFRDDRAGLMVTVLSAAVPMFVVGAVLITIDSPMFLCWAATVYCLWRAVEGEGGWKKWIYLAGVACAAGMLFKPVLIAMPLCALVAAWVNPRMRRAFINWHGLVALVIVLSSEVPFVIWNSQHSWVTFRHLGGQAGMKGGEGTVALLGFPGRMLGFVAGQAGGMAGVMFILMVIACVIAWRAACRNKDGSPVFGFLLAFTVPLWLFYLLLNITTNTQINWPAASYFTGMILLAGVATAFWMDRGHPRSRAWRHWMIGAVAWGLIAATLIQNTQWFYPMAQRHLAAKTLGTEAYYKSWWHPRHWDPGIRLREPEPRAATVQAELDAMTAATGKAPMVVSVRYNIASSLDFYLKGRPFAFCIGPWVGARQSQYDLWPGVNEKDVAGRLVHEGENWLLVGDLDPSGEEILRGAFERCDAAEIKPVMYLGIDLRAIRVQRFYGFRGLPVTPSTRTY